MSICSSYAFPLSYALSEDAYHRFLDYDKNVLIEKCKHCNKIIRSKLLNFARRYDKEKETIELFLTEKGHGSIDKREFVLKPDDVNVKKLLMLFGIIPSDVLFKNERVQSSEKNEDVHILFSIEWKIHLSKNNVWFLQLDSRESEVKNFIFPLVKMDEMQLPRVKIELFDGFNTFVPDITRILASMTFKDDAFVKQFQCLFVTEILQALVFYSKIWYQIEESQNKKIMRLRPVQFWNTHEGKKFLKHSPWTISTSHGSLAVGAESPLEWIFSAVIFRPRLSVNKECNLAYMIPLPSFGHFDLFSSSLTDAELNFVKEHFNLNDIETLENSIDVLDSIFNYVKKNSKTPVKRVEELFRPLVPLLRFENQLYMWRKVIEFYRSMIQMSDGKDWLNLEHETIDIWSSEETENVYSRRDQILVHLPIVPFGQWIDVATKV